MFEIGDLVRIKEEHLQLFDKPDDLGLVVKIEKHFYRKGPLGTGPEVSTDRVYIDWLYDDMNFVYPANILEKV
jgi:hypothetical protein